LKELGHLFLGKTAVLVCVVFLPKLLEFLIKLFPWESRYFLPLELLVGSFDMLVSLFNYSLNEVACLVLLQFSVLVRVVGLPYFINEHIEDWSEVHGLEGLSTLCCLLLCFLKLRKELLILFLPFLNTLLLSNRRLRLLSLLGLLSTQGIGFLLFVINSSRSSEKLGL